MEYGQVNFRMMYRRNGRPLMRIHTWAGLDAVEVTEEVLELLRQPRPIQIPPLVGTVIAIGPYRATVTHVKQEVKTIIVVRVHSVWRHIVEGLHNIVGGALFRVFRKLYRYKVPSL